ncbi:MAG TPA: polysaccharide deacetylase family protein [Chitinophagaceae bacterium]|nr:polysaccharide deacetylase family protein [Chitinophagaceae bacterium]
MNIFISDENFFSSKRKYRIFLFLFSVLIFPCNFSCKQQKVEINTENYVEAARIVTREKQKAIADSLARLNPKKKIYLTFDDGPNKGTGNVLKTVKEEKIPASFFVVGKHVFDSPSQGKTFQELKSDSTVEICNHSYTHAYNHYSKYYDNPEDVVKDFQRNKEVLSLISQVSRMPGRNAWRIDTVIHTDIQSSKPAIDSVHNAGFMVMGWDIEWIFDHKTLEPSPDTDLLLRQIQNMLEASTTKTPGHLVLLAHDQSFRNEADIEKLRYFIQQLKNNPDYELLLASNYPGVIKTKVITSTVTEIPANKQ